MESPICGVTLADISLLICLRHYNVLLPFVTIYALLSKLRNYCAACASTTQSHVSLIAARIWLLYMHVLYLATQPDEFIRCPERQRCLPHPRCVASGEVLRKSSGIVAPVWLRRSRKKIFSAPLTQRPTQNSRPAQRSPLRTAAKATRALRVSAFPCCVGCDFFAPPWFGFYCAACVACASR